VRIFEPQGSGPFPAILRIHGGAWTQGDRTNDEVVNQALAASGLLVASIDFRQAPAHPYPASVADVNYATRWLKAHAADFRGDASRLGAHGTSSGGHLAVLSAMRPGDARYAALSLAGVSDVDATLAYVVAGYPILDPHARYLFAQETGREDLVKRTAGYFLNEETMQEGNPQRILDGKQAVDLPPVLILQGTEDTNVTPAMQERFVAAYRAAGGDIQLEIFAGMPHGFLNRSGPDPARAFELTTSFIARQLGAPAAVA
jgi:acetyl esterase/lipase